MRTLVEGFSDHNCLRWKRMLPSLEPCLFTINFNISNSFILSPIVFNNVIMVIIHWCRLSYLFVLLLFGFYFGFFSRCSLTKIILRKTKKKRQQTKTKRKRKTKIKKKRREKDEEKEICTCQPSSSFCSRYLRAPQLLISNNKKEGKGKEIIPKNQ